MPRVIIELEIEGTSEEAFAVVDAILDNGDLQELINNDESPLRVMSAICRSAEDGE